MSRIWRNNGLSLTLLGLFTFFLAGQALTGFHEHNEELLVHGQPALTFGSYLMESHFWEAVFENWESEFLQMSAYVWLTAFLFQKGSAESKDPGEAFQSNDA